MEWFDVVDCSGYHNRERREKIGNAAAFDSAQDSP